MNQKANSGSQRVPHVAAICLLALAVGLLAITRQSFWMDEGSTVIRAMMPDIASWWNLSLHLGGSDVQMPVYMFTVWAWEKTGANTEYLLRLVNLPWILLGAAALMRVRWWPVVFLASPFVWYYAGELRPYAMQIAGGAVAAWAMLRVAESTPDGQSQWRGLHAAAGAALLLVAGSLSAAIWAVGLWLGVLILRPDWLLKKGFWLRILPWLLPIGTLCGFYLYTVMEGYRATSSGGGGLLGMIYGFYELIGLSGLGPGRSELRADPLSLLKWLPLVVPGALLLAVAWGLGISRWATRSTRRQQVAVALAVGVPLLALAAVGLLMDFRVLGRHLSPMLPAVLLPIALALESGIARKSIRSTVLAVLAFFFMLASALSLRFFDQHARDDYRSAANLALDAMAAGRTVVWSADMNCARFYAYQRGGMEWVNRIQKWETGRPASLFFVHMVVINRPDVYALSQHHRNALEADFTPTDHPPRGFEIWKSR